MFDPEQALDRALLIFWRHGYEGVTMADLTEAMGINRTSLYAAFGNKRELFNQALNRYAETDMAYPRHATPWSPRPPDKSPRRFCAPTPEPSPAPTASPAASRYKAGWPAARPTRKCPQPWPVPAGPENQPCANASRTPSATATFTRTRTRRAWLDTS